jgi:hypothetical protein
LSLAPPAGIRNPVLTADDVTDVPALYVADPFMAHEGGMWHMLFEVLNASQGKGEIALASSSDGFNWNYRQIVLREPFHVGYPYFFAVGRDYYMIPETYWTSSVRLYKAVDFPRTWTLVKVLLKGDRYSDASIVSHDGRWWLFVLRGSKELAVFFSDQLTGPWTEHPASPMISRNPHITRPGGRMLALDGKIIRYTQDCYPVYGSQVRAFEIDTLTPTRYAERPAGSSPVVTASGHGWNRDGMHHVDAHPVGTGSWIACVDGLRVGKWYEHAISFIRAVRLAGEARNSAEVDRSAEGLDGGSWPTADSRATEVRRPAKASAEAP